MALGCGALVLITVLIVAAVVWAKFPERVEGDYFDSGGVRIHYTDEGTGTPVVLVHGLAANIDQQWRSCGIIDALAQDYHVVALDTRGHGLSDKPHDAAQYGMNMVEDVIRLMDHLEIEKAHVVGYSMGGLITIKLLTTHTERLLSAAPCGMGWEPLTDENRAMAEEVAKALDDCEGFGPLGKKLGLDDGKPHRTKRLILKLALTFLVDNEALAAVVRAIPQLAVQEAQLRANKLPILNMVGSKDGLRPICEKLAEVTPNCEQLIIEGKDHMTTPGAPAFIERLQTFLAKHTPKPPESTS